MSVIRCDRCVNFIDSDENPDAYEPESESWVCDECRNDEMAYWRAQYNAAPLSERNPEQYRREMIDAGRGHLLPEDGEPIARVKCKPSGVRE